MAKSRRRAIDRGSARRSRRRRATAALLLPALLAVWTPGCGVRTARSDWIRPTPAAEPEVRARWEELPPLVEGRDVEMVLRDGVCVRGRAGEVTPEALLLRVRRTSDPAVIPKGPIPIPREQVSALTLRWRKGPARAVLATTFAAGGFALLLHQGVTPDPDKWGWLILPVWSGMAAGLGMIGHVVGRKIDGRQVQVVVSREPPAPNGSHSFEEPDHLHSHEGGEP